MDVVGDIAGFIPIVRVFVASDCGGIDIAPVPPNRLHRRTRHERSIRFNHLHEVEVGITAGGVDKARPPDCVHVTDSEAELNSRTRALIGVGRTSGPQSTTARRVDITLFVRRGLFEYAQFLAAKSHVPRRARASWP